MPSSSDRQQTSTDQLEREPETDRDRRCQDFDEDCPDIAAEGGCLSCWLYDPGKGYCPYLRGEL